jgi:UDP-N-acetylglucosamine 3-dehydrogenase
MQRVALVGAGNMGRRHAAAYAEIPNAQLVAVCDNRELAAEEFAGAHDIPAFPTVDKMVSGVQPDIIDICTPTATHAQMIRSASGNRRHIIAEKPLGRTGVEVRESIRLTREAGVTLCVGHVLRWFPEFKRLHELTVAGAVGNPAVIRTSRINRHPGGWFAEHKKSGGVILDLLVHDFDWMRWTFGDVKRVHAVGLVESRIPMRDYALVTLRFKSGVIAHVEGSWCQPSEFGTSVEIAGSEGLLSFNSREASPLRIDLRTENGAAVSYESPFGMNPLKDELTHFIDCIENGTEPMVKPEDGLEAVRVAEAALKSIHTGNPVTL